MDGVHAVCQGSQSSAQDGCLPGAGGTHDRHELLARHQSTNNGQQGYPERPDGADILLLLGAAKGSRANWYKEQYT
jgi:hypothetical protein